MKALHGCIPRYEFYCLPANSRDTVCNPYLEDGENCLMSNTPEGLAQCIWKILRNNMPAAHQLALAKETVIQHDFDAVVDKVCSHNGYGSLSVIRFLF